MRQIIATGKSILYSTKFHIVTQNKSDNKIDSKD